jgi:DnaJ family protein C protein 9
LDALFPQILGRVYAVLSDKEQRAVYDEQGVVDEDSAVLNQDRDWEAYWRLLFKKVGGVGSFFMTIPVIQ